MNTTTTASRSRSGGYRETRLPGGFIAISAHTLILGYWLYRSGNITKRQFRIWLAAHEMRERRRHSAPGRGPERPLFRVAELARLVGGRGSQAAQQALRADVRHLARIGLVKIRPHSIELAVSVDQIRLADVSGFWTMFEQIPNHGRQIPVPRRTLRALAGGFDRATTAALLACLLRGLYWNRQQGDYRTDGRVKGSWIADVFLVSRRAVTDGLARLIELGWLERLECPQWQLNKWGQHYRIVSDWQPAGERAGGQSDSASPRAADRTDSASPCLNQSASLTRTSKKTSRPDPTRSDPAGVSRRPIRGKDRSSSGAGQGGPQLRDIRSEDLACNQALQQLYRQAIAVGWAGDSEAGRLAFFSLAERARARGNRPGALLTWLLREQRYAFITQSDEDAALDRIRELRDGPARPREAELQRRGRAAAPPDLSESDRFVQACIRVAKQHHREPFLIAAAAKQWTRPQWDQALWDYQQGQFGRCSGAKQNC